jgi:hypothetical protein
MPKRIAMFRLPSLAVVVFTFAFFAGRAFCAEFTAEKSKHGVVIKIDGKPFTEYISDSNGKPILWPIYGPTDVPMTRNFPMCEKSGEATDHPHHRSMWCAHGDVNGISFWLETPTKEVPKLGKVVQTEFTQVAGGTTAVVATKNNWIGPDGKRVCSDARVLRFGADDIARWIDFDITLNATDGDLVFGDTKEGFFGVRVAEPLRVLTKSGAKIVNSNGLTDVDAWGKNADWVDDYGTLEGQKVGVAIFDHPLNPRHPVGWHTRLYGLLGANPFAGRAFSGDAKQNGSMTVKNGESVRFRYRVLFHRGDPTDAKIAERFAAYAKEAKEVKETESKNTEAH